MSEPSPEAKQAARDWRRDTLTQLGEREAYAEGYDTATAKAREELEGERFTRAHWEDRAEKAEKLLAHQQPSAPTEDVEKIATEIRRIKLAFPMDDDRTKRLEELACETAAIPAQARAPLVEALEEAISFMDTGKGRSQILIDKCRAALTGTGEKG